MTLNAFAMYRKKYLFIPLICLISITTLFAQVVAPTSTSAPTPSPTQGQGTPAPSQSQGQGQGQGQAQGQNQGQTRTATLPNGQQVQVPVDASVTDPVNQQDVKSTTEENIKTAEEIENDKQTAAISAAEAARIALRQKIFGYSVFANNVVGPMGAEQSIATPLNYTIGPGDALNLYIYGYYGLPEQSLNVNRDGFVTIPRVGQVNLGGMTIEEAQKVLIGKFSTFVPGLFGSNGNPPPTKLLLTLGQTRQITIFMTGELVNPGSYSMSSLASAFNALFRAGGPNEIGTFRDIKVIRNNKVISTLDIYDYIMDGTITGDVRLQDNDRISIGLYKKRVELTGSVKRAKIFEPKEGETLGDILRYAGGFNDNAYRGMARIKRITSRERRVLEVYEAQFDTFELVNGDVIDFEAVLDRFENVVTIGGAVMRPGEYSIDNNPNLTTLLKNADGLQDDAYTGRIRVERTRADKSIEFISLNLGEILNGKAPDLELTRLDVISIPSRFDLAEQSSVSIQGELNETDGAGSIMKVPYMAGMKLEDLIQEAGGFKESAKASQVEVYRRVRDSNAKAADAEISEVYKFDVSRDLSLDGNDTNFELMPFDEVIVRRSPNYQEQRFVYMDGEFLNPGEYGITSKNEKITDLIKRAGGLTDLAYIKGATLIRSTPVSDYENQQTATALGQISNEVRKGSLNVSAGGGMRQEFIGIQLEKILKNPDSDDNIIIQEGDVLRVPKRLETVQVKGSLLYPTTVKYNDDMNFLDYVSQSGGFTKSALRRSAYIKYPNGSVDRTRRFLMFNVYPKVEPGSEIYVPTKGAAALTPQQVLQQGISITSTLFSLIITVLAFRSIR